ncbi:hypothetical protein SapgrDRAFT_2753 [Saprospira grandis DSM 2844]|uniref:Outer membrane protein beta-barrel domain-containing protein n=1 Tax=Saprospira grandis DSM 2844 TaxID=694433 RepID=J1I7K1_9BACT|nr:hypothetical protein [Saprospira grandis]EJF54408.1 hypothetical protein SapgrDRAFT_2753 [Saprospira grandis DSM 2844]
MRIMTYRHLFILLFSCLSLSSFAQLDDETYDTEEKREPLRNNRPGDLNDEKRNPLKGFFIGSSAGLDLWNSLVRVDLSPHLGYRLSSFAHFGLGINYTYMYEMTSQANLHLIGPKAFLRIRPLPQYWESFYLHGELEQLYVRESNPNYNGGNNPPKYFQDIQPRANIGFGYTSNFDNGLGIFTEFLFDIYYLRSGTTYVNPVTYRAGLHYGF